MSAEQKRVDAYLHTVSQLEPDIHPVDQDAALTSIAVSLRRIADAMQSPNEYGEVGSAALAGAISRSLRNR